MKRCVCTEALLNGKLGKKCYSRVSEEELTFDVDFSAVDRETIRIIVA